MTFALNMIGHQDTQIQLTMYKGKNTHVIIPFSLNKPNDTITSMNIVTTCYKDI